MALKLFFDGGCRPNPGPMESAVVAKGRTHHRPPHIHGTNGEAEWQALLHALDVAEALGEPDVILIGDSTHALKRAPTDPVYITRAAQFTRIRLRHTPRAQNLAGIALDRINAHQTPPHTLYPPHFDEVQMGRGTARAAGGGGLNRREA